MFGFYWENVRVILALYWDNGKVENYNLGFRIEGLRNDAEVLVCDPHRKPCETTSGPVRSIHRSGLVNFQRRSTGIHLWFCYLS